MALFGRKKKEATKEKAAAPATPRAAASASSGSQNNLSHVLQNPRITEKATMHQALNVYTFDVAEHAGKPEIRDAVRALYGVVPRKVRVVTIPAKQRRNVRTGASGVSRGGKKAYVYLKKGETIAIT